MDLPTVDLQRVGVIDSDVLDEYIEDVQGHALTRCEVEPHQRKLLLDIVLAYRAFYEGDPHPSEPYAYELFITLLVEAATSVEDHDGAEPLLIEIVAWLKESVFPMVSA